MGIARGIATAVQMWNETAYGVDPVSIAAEKMFYRTFNPSGSLKRLMDETITGRRGMPSSIAGDKDVTGQILTTFAPQSALRYLQHLVGGPTTTGGASPYTHAFNLAGALPTSFGMQVDYGATLAAPGRFLHLLGCRIAKGSFKFQPSGFIDATYDVRGADFNLTDTVVADAAAAEYGHTGFSMFSAVVTEGGSPIGDLAEVM
nr:phage tail tube protein [Dokdonella sp.]